MSILGSVGSHTGLPMWAILLIGAFLILAIIRLAKKLLHMAIGTIVVLFLIFMYLNHWNVSKSFDDTRNVTVTALSSMQPAVDKLKEFAANNAGYDVKKVSDNEYDLTDKDGLKVQILKNGDQTKLMGQAPLNNPQEIKKLGTIAAIYIHPANLDVAAKIASMKDLSSPTLDLSGAATVKTDGTNVYIESK